MNQRVPHPILDGCASPMEKLVALSRHFGSDIEFIIAGGGNTSFKEDGRLFVKGSGTSLARITPDDFVEMERHQLAELLHRDLGDDPAVREVRFKDAILAARIHPERGQRPSVECVLHNMLPERYVVHTHSTYANMISCCTAGDRLSRALFGDEILWIPYVDPGYTLARTLQSALETYAQNARRSGPRAVLMQNHGLIVSGDEPDEILGTSEWIVSQIRRRLDSMSPNAPSIADNSWEPEVSRRMINQLAPALRSLLATGNTLKIVRFDDSPSVRSLVSSAHGMDQAAQGPLTPDQIVYCQSYPLCFTPDPSESAESCLARLRGALKLHRDTRGYPPQIVLVERLGLFAVGDDYVQAENARLSYADAIKIMIGASLLGGTRALPERDRRFIEEWEVESYRRKIAAGMRGAGRVAGKVAMVTGAAQGFGLGISRDLAAEGAYAILCDINERGVRQAAAGLVESHGSGRALSLAVNVTDDTSVSEAMHAIVRNYGGLDLVISNAGILRAGSVTSQPEEDFDLVTRVNYKGYFLVVRNAAPIMSLQHSAGSGCWSDIIQINSKSGLAGSNRNGAYAGSKFGGIGLTQSFALELVESGIKVNAICPGNYFDGPLWSDPETGLFVQYLRTGKVPGARTLEDVRRFYESRVPMGRGCTTTDVMKAIYYIIDQKYETGQALPVTGGQVMLS